MLCSCMHDVYSLITHSSTRAWMCTSACDRARSVSVLRQYAAYVCVEYVQFDLSAEACDLCYMSTGCVRLASQSLAVSVKRFGSRLLGDRVSCKLL